MSGLDRALEESTSLPAAIDAGIGQHNNYLTYLLNAVATNVPVGDAVILAGHSLGGLNAQLAAIAPALRGFHPNTLVVCFGAFYNGPPAQGRRYTMFMEPSDIIRTVTWLSGPGRAYEGLPLNIVTPSTPGLSFSQQHNDYPDTPYLDGWNPDGSIHSSVQQRPWQLGPTIRVAAKLTPP